MCIKSIMQSGYIEEDSRPNLSLKSQFTKKNKKIRVFRLSLLFVSYSRIALIFELDYVVEL